MKQHSYGGGNLLHGLFQEGYTSENIAFYIGKMVIAENRQLWINCFLSQQANAELGAVWSVGQRIWQRDFPGIYTTISAHQWSETIQPIMEALRGTLIFFVLDKQQLSIIINQRYIVAKHLSVLIKGSQVSGVNEKSSLEKLLGMT